MKTHPEQGKPNPSKSDRLPLWSSWAGPGKAPVDAAGNSQQGHKQKCHHHHFFPRSRAGHGEINRPYHTVRLGFHSNPTVAAGAPTRDPRLAPDRAGMLESQQPRPQQDLEVENKLCSGSEKPKKITGGKIAATILAFYRGKLQEYLVCRADAGPVG